MTSKQQKEMRKKKKRAAESHQKVLKKREALRAVVREDRAERRMIKRIKKLQKDMGELNVWSEEMLKQLPEKTINQLEHNAKILKTLEEEHAREAEKKQQLNEQLEKEGAATLDQKLQTLHQRTVEQQQAAEEQRKVVSETSKCNMWIAPRQPKDVADVEIVKAPTEELTAEVKENS